MENKSGFYKHFNNPIELVRIPEQQTSTEYQPRNVGNGDLYGIEFELRKSFLKNFSFNTNVTIAVSPFPPASFQKATFDVTLKDDKGQAITDAQVTLDLTMPSMRMPTNKPTAQKAGNGKYTATATWTMRGWWRIEVIIVRGGVKQSAFFDTWL